MLTLSFKAKLEAASAENVQLELFGNSAENGEGFCWWGIERKAGYLSFAYSRFAANECPMVAFGHCLNDTDSHLVRAMQEWRSVDVAISLRQDDSAKIIERKAKLLTSPPKAKLVFFDAATHPLGKDELRIPNLTI